MSSDQVAGHLRWLGRRGDLGGTFGGFVYFFLFLFVCLGVSFLCFLVWVVLCVSFYFVWKVCVCLCVFFAGFCVYLYLLLCCFFFCFWLGVLCVCVLYVVVFYLCYLWRFFFWFCFYYWFVFVLIEGWVGFFSAWVFLFLGQKLDGELGSGRGFECVDPVECCFLCRLDIYEFMNLYDKCIQSHVLLLKLLVNRIF